MSVDFTSRFGLTELPTPVVAPAFDADHNMMNKGEGYIWSHLDPPPAIGASVVIAMNQLGPGVVESYFVEHGFLGVKVKLDNEPAWHARQNKGTQYAGVAHVFGAELKGGQMVRS